MRVADIPFFLEFVVPILRAATEKGVE